MADGSLNFDTKIDKSGFEKGLSSVSGAFSKVGGLFKTAGVAIGGLAAAGTGAFAAITKSALDGVAQLEQNIGGVETLFTNEFGSAADAVIKNANRAYETAGMSANDYMSTVTSFSASLLQAVGNDTEEAAKVADMAIIDMSDNANKMGSNMQDIQNAYQGFAKQNYTMLDNLKLGYGGTKTEMERLLKDAEKLTGVKYDINNLSDVYNAIHAIQGELGITGTTAKEAASTIEGSMNSAKAAWSNFMDGTGSVKELADAFGTAAEVIVKNLGEIIPRLTETLPALIDAVGRQIPALVESLLPALVTGGTSLLSSFARIFPSLLGSAASIAPVLIDAVQGLMGQLLDAATSFDFTGAAQSIVDGITGFINGNGLGQLLDTATQIVTALVTGISQALPTLIPAAVQLMAYFAQTLIENIASLVPAALQLIQGLAEGILSALPVLASALPGIIDTIVTTLIGSLPQIIDVAVNIILALIDGIVQAIPQLAAAIPQIIDSIVTALTAALPQIIQAGITLLNGLIEAIPTIIQALVAALPQIITAIVDGLTSAVPQIIQAGITLLMALIEAIPQIVVALAENLPQIITAIANGLSQAIPQIFTAAKDLLWQIIEAVPEIVSGLAGAVPDIIAGIVDGLKNGLSAVKDAALELGGSILDGIKSFFGINSPSTVMAEQGGYLVQGLVNGISEMPAKMAQTLSDTLAKVTQWGQQMLSSVQSSVQNVLNTAEQIISQLPGKIWTHLVNVVTKVTQWGQQMLNAAKTAVSTMISSVVSLMSELPGKIWTHLVNVVTKVTQWGQQMLAAAKTAISNMISSIVSLISELPEKVWTWLVNTVTKVTQWGQQMLNAAKTAISDMVSNVISILTQLPGKVQAELTKVTSGMVSWGSEIVGKMKEVGSNIVTGIWNGISSGWDWLKDKVASLANSLLGAAKDALGIDSPSKAFRDEVGRYLMPGAVEGVKKSLPAAIRDMKGAAAELISSMQSSVNAQMGAFTLNASGAADRLAFAGGSVTNIDNSQHQENTYNVPVATPSEVNKAQREAFRKFAGGVK